MKNKIATLILTLASAVGFAQNMPAQNLNVDLKAEIKPKKSYGYLRMGASDYQLPTNKFESLPGIGFGYRLSAGPSILDLSASFHRRSLKTEEGMQKTYFYTYPKANYLYYLNSSDNNSLYGGGGLAWGKMKTKEGDRFHGIIPNVAVGYEMNRKAAWRSFVQLDVNQPALAASSQGSLPGPFVEVSLGAGF